VSEFAGMSPQQLLRETQRAAGDENLTSWHDTLIGSGKSCKLLQEVCIPYAHFAYSSNIHISSRL
jgi:hypothetical protein